MACATIRDARCLGTIIDTYYHHSGQVINYTKSHATFSHSTPLFIKYSICHILHVAEKHMPWQYLDVPVSVRTFLYLYASYFVCCWKTHALAILGCSCVWSALYAFDYQPLSNKVTNYITTRKWITLSFAGRVTLIHYVLSSIPLHVLSFVYVPTNVLYQLEKEIRAFLWGHPSDVKGFH